MALFNFLTVRSKLSEQVFHKHRLKWPKRHFYVSYVIYTNIE
jgi:hypothetical protein